MIKIRLRQRGFAICLQHSYTKVFTAYTGLIMPKHRGRCAEGRFDCRELPGMLGPCAAGTNQCLKQIGSSNPSARSQPARDADVVARKR